MLYYFFYPPDWIYLIVVYAFPLGLNILLMYLIYKDARQRNMDEKAWAAFICFTSCIGCLVYLMVRTPKPQDKIYQEQSYQLESSYSPSYPKRRNSIDFVRRTNDKYCTVCGSQLDSETKLCIKCQENSKILYCPNCGSQLNEFYKSCPQCKIKYIS